MVFGKKGRPSEDRLARQREIFGAVSPLIQEVGARRLSMRQAANAACLSIGGLYHYFPTKRDLVLHGLRPEAIYRYCQDFHAEFGHLAYLDPRRYIDIGIDVVVEQVEFCRPAIYAALELGTESFWEIIDTLLTGTVGDFEVNLRRVVPKVSDQELHLCGRAIRRSISAALLDKNITPDEFRDELHLLIDGYIARASQGEHAPVEALTSTTTGLSRKIVPH
jgi:AcrR family transcriptional regulator